MAKTKLEELVIELSVQNKSLTTQLKKSQGDTNKAMAQMAKSVEGFAKDSNKSVSSFQRIFETAIGFVGGQAVMAAFSKAKDAAMALFNSLVSDGVAAAQVQEDAINNLNSALARTGKFSAETSTDLQGFASALQQNSKFGDEAILTNMALIQSLGGLETEGLKGATQATLDMAAALNIDLKAAATLVGKAAAGEVSSFTRYGVAIEKGTTKAETFANTLEALNSKFGGAAAAQVKTYSGSVQQLSNTYGDFTEEIGFVFTQNTALSGSISELNNIFTELSGEVGDNREYLQSFVKDGIILAAEAIPLLVSAVDSVVDVYGFWQQSTAQIAIWTAKLTGESEELVAVLEKQADEEARAHLEREENMRAVGERAAEMRDRIVAAAEEGAQSQSEMNKVFEAQSEAARKAQEETEAFTEAQTKQAEAGRDLALQTIEGMEEDNQVKRELMQEQFNAELEMLAAAKNQELITEEQYLTSLKALRDKNRKKEEKDQKKSDNAQLALAEKSANAKVNIASASANLISSIAGRESKIAFGVQKAAAIAQSIVATNVAAARALASAPPPANFALAATTKAAGYINTAAITATAIQGFRHGIDEVPGIGFQDNFPAVLAPGERVVPRETNQDLKTFLSQAQSGNGNNSGVARIEIVMRDDLIDFIEARLIERENLNVSMRGA